MSLINYGKHFINNDDVNNVNKILRSNFLTQGRMVEKFETNLKKYLKASIALQYQVELQRYIF